MFEGAIQDLIEELGRLPGVGPKGAQRIAFYLLAAEPTDVERLADILKRVKNDASWCRTRTRGSASAIRSAIAPLSSGEASSTMQTSTSTPGCSSMALRTAPARYEPYL
jgi:hypothetical protein